MALLKYDPAATSIHGSRGGSVFFSSRSGFSSRAKPQPVRNPTNRREPRREAFSIAVVRWRDVLSPAQRSSWVALGASTVFTDAAGNPYNPIGLNLYVRTNALRIFYSLSPIDTAPPSAVATAFNIQFLFADQASDLSAVANASMPDSYLTFFDISVPLSPTIFFHNGPFAFNSNSSGVALKAGSSIIPVSTFSKGDRVSIRSRQMASDGSLSDPSFLIFPCEESLMFIYQLVHNGTTISVAQPGSYLLDGTIQLVANNPVTGIQPVHAVDCRLRHLAIHIRTRAQVGAPPELFIEFRKNGAIAFNWFLTGTTAPFSTFYLLNSDLSSPTFAPGDKWGAQIRAAVTGVQSSQFDKIMFQAYFEPGDFS
jgi:hypothetical protein